MLQGNVSLESRVGRREGLRKSISVAEALPIG